MNKVTVQDLHNHLDNTRSQKMMGCLMFEIDGIAYYIVNHELGFSVNNEYNQILFVVDLSDYNDYEDKVLTICDNMLNDAYDKIIEIESTLLYGV